MSAAISLSLRLPPEAAALVGRRDTQFMSALHDLGGSRERASDTTGVIYLASGTCTLTGLARIIGLADELARHVPCAVRLDVEHDGDDVSRRIGHGADAAELTSDVAALVEQVRGLPPDTIRRFLAALEIGTLPVQVTEAEGDAFRAAARRHGGFGRALADAWATADSENRRALYLVFRPIVQQETEHG